MALIYFASLFHGLALHELCCVAYFLLSRLVERPANAKQPIFIAASFTYLLMWISFIYANVVLEFNARFTATMMGGWTMDQMNQWFSYHAINSSYVSLIVSVALMVVIMMRTTAVLKQEQYKLFRYYSYVVCLVMAGGCAASFYYLPIVFSWGYNYNFHPAYSIYLVVHGLLVSTVLSFHMVVSAIAFLYVIYSSRGIPVNEFLYDWAIKQNGARYFIMAGFNIFNIACFFYAMINGQNAVSLIN
jgi:hypothetical protein